jgi:hypothetical protein
MSDTPTLPQIPSSMLKPYASLTMLECPDDQRAEAVALLADICMRLSRDVRNATVAIVASGLADAQQFLTLTAAGNNQIEQLDGFVYRVSRPPSWGYADAGFVDSDNALCLIARRRRLIALYGNATLRNALVAWLLKYPQPFLRLVPQNILQGAFLRGEAKVLWLRGAHSPRATRPDSKQLSGRDLREALNPLDDNSFSMMSAKAAIPSDQTRVALTGNIGTTPTKGTVWNKPTQSFSEFIQLALEVMNAIEETAATGSELDRPYPILAITTNDISQVSGAYDIGALGPASLPSEGDVDPDLMAAAEMLERAVMIVHGSPGSADFRMEVGLDGAIGGAVLVRTEARAHGVGYSFGPDGAGTHPQLVRDVLDALAYSDELITVYYDSGHTVTGGRIVAPSVRPQPFRCWDFRDFRGFDITREKPAVTPQDIHDRIGIGGDRSLFSWVAQNYASGFLTCDDGPGEVCDFVHIAHDCTLTYIHVKAAATSSPGRGVAVAEYEVVSSQAVKNLTTLTPDLLRDRLSASRVARPGCWVDGARVDDRTAFLEALEYVGLQDAKQVVIVQPHVNKALYDAVRKSQGTGADDLNLYRLQLLDTLLNAARSAAVYAGGDLRVVGALI